MKDGKPRTGQQKSGERCDDKTGLSLNGDRVLSFAKLDRPRMTCGRISRATVHDRRSKEQYGGWWHEAEEVYIVATMNVDRPYDFLYAFSLYRRVRATSPSVVIGGEVYRKTAIYLTVYL